jgi:hypothetical protein
MRLALAQARPLPQPLSRHAGEGSYGSAEFGSADESTHTKVG